MRNKLKKIVALFLAVVLLAGVAGSVGCGGGGVSKASSEILVGILADFTGPAALAVKAYVQGAQDYFRYAEEQGLVPEGVKIKTITYDQRSDPSRVLPGYYWLKGQGIKALFVISPTDESILEDKVAADRMLIAGAHCSETKPGAPYIYGWWPTQSSEGEAEMQWIMETWDYAGKGRPPKVGYQTWTLPSGGFFETGINLVIQANPGKFDWKGTNKSPLSTSSWAVEVGKFKDCDYIVITLVGSTLASFVAEARARGYTGSFITGTSGFPGYFELVLKQLSQQQLNGFYFVMASPFYNDDLPLVHEFLDAYAIYRPEVTYEHLTQGDTGPMGGWATAMFIVDALARAVNAVGASNLTGESLAAALDATNMTVEGFSPDNTWRFPQDYHTAIRAYKTFEFKAADGEWKSISGWLVPPSLKPYQ